jgi:arginine/lysine/ornithine decarboxylase
MKDVFEMNQYHTPLFDKLVQHHKQQSISYHVPGHKNGMVVSHEAIDYYGSLLSLDLTEITNLDDLHSPEGVIKEAEELLAAAYQTKHSFFLINGSTSGNLAMILASFREGDIVFIQRNCHKSVLNGLKLAKLKPVFIEPEYNEEWQVATGVSITNLIQAYQAYPEGKGVILTYPNYYGFTFDIKTIIDFCHSHDMLVLVDEAHGAHLVAGDPFPPSSLVFGADVVVQSAHKTLPAMTMSAFLHINSDRVKLERIKNYLQILQSSSPSYPLMASLDLARSYIATYTELDKQYFMRIRESFINQLESITSIRVLYHESEGDLLKITLQSTQGLTGFELQKKLEAVNIFTELADPYNVLFVLPLLKNNASYPLKESIFRIKEALTSIENKVLAITQVKRNQANGFSRLAMDYQNQDGAQTEIIPIHKSIGRVSAEMIIPYPPGIPLLMEGEKITVGKVEDLLKLLDLGSKFHGGEFLTEGNIKVFVMEEVQ